VVHVVQGVAEVVVVVVVEEVPEAAETVELEEEKTMQTCSVAHRAVTFHRVTNLKINTSVQFTTVKLNHNKWCGVCVHRFSVLS
jgi:hypothetical protein